MRWFGRWLRRRRLREWWPDSANGGRRKKFAEERERLEGEERESRWLLGGRLVRSSSNCL
jgi:hypothetical protein